MILYLKDHCKELNVSVLDEEDGLGIISRKTPHGPAHYSPTNFSQEGLDKFSASLSYKDLLADRKGILNLKNLSDLEKIIKIHTCQIES